MDGAFYSFQLKVALTGPELNAFRKKYRTIDRYMLEQHLDQILVISTSNFLAEKPTYHSEVVKKGPKSWYLMDDFNAKPKSNHPNAYSTLWKMEKYLIYMGELEIYHLEKEEWSPAEVQKKLALYSKHMNLVPEAEIRKG